MTINAEGGWDVSGSEQPELFEPRHESLQLGRLGRYPELIYAEEWRRMNDRRRWPARSGFPILEHILAPDGEAPRPVKQRDATTAACVVQWLGTNCGMAFLNRCERRISETSHSAERLERSRWQFIYNRPTPVLPDRLMAFAVATRVHRLKSVDEIASWVEAALEQARLEGREDERRDRQARLTASNVGQRGIVLGREELE